MRMFVRVCDVCVRLFVCVCECLCVFVCVVCVFVRVCVCVMIHCVCLQGGKHRKNNKKNIFCDIIKPCGSAIHGVKHLAHRPNTWLDIVAKDCKNFE